MSAESIGNKPFCSTSPPTVMESSLTTHANSPKDKVLGSATGSMVATMSPYIPPSSPARRGRAGKRNTSKRNAETLEMLPGYYVNNSYSKYLTYSIENSNVSDVDIFELHRNIVNCIGREPKITSQGNGSAY